MPKSRFYRLTIYDFDGEKMEYIVKAHTAYAVAVASPQIAEKHGHKLPEAVDVLVERLVNGRYGNFIDL